MRSFVKKGAGATSTKATPKRAAVKAPKTDKKEKKDKKDKKSKGPKKGAVAAE